MRTRNLIVAAGVIALALLALPLDVSLAQAAAVEGSGLLFVGLAGTLSEIRLLDTLGYGDRALSKGDVVKVGSGKEAVDASTAEQWVRAGLAISMEPQEGPNLSPAATRVVVHERGGQELLQAATTITPEGDREGPAPENPTDSDPEEDAEEGHSRTAAGAVIAENADPEPVAEKETKTRKGRK